MLIDYVACINEASTRPVSSKRYYPCYEYDNPLLTYE